MGPAQQKEQNEGRLLELDALRGLAALYVLVFHFICSYQQSLGSKAFEISRFFTGIYGVQLFFIISGYVIFMSLDRIARPLDFIVSRFSRLFPAYWAAVIIATFLIKRYYVYDFWVSPESILLNFSMMQGWFGIRNIDGVYWTLSIELVFYIAMFILYLLKGFRRIEVWGLMWLAAMAVFSRLDGPAAPIMDIHNLLVFGNLFFAGIIFYRLKTYGKTLFRYFCLALCLAVQMMVKVHIHSGYLADPLLTTFIILVFFVVFHMAVFGQLKFIAARPMVFLGTISYSLYLTHSHLSLILIRYMVVHEINVFLIFFIPLVCSLILAALVTFVVEKPAMHAIRALYQSLRKHKDEVGPKALAGIKDRVNHC